MPVNDYLKYVIKILHDRLLESDGRVVGVRFNKFLYLLDRDLRKDRRRPIDLKLPYRWYFYGVIPVQYQLSSCYIYSHPEEEWRTTVKLKPYPSPEIPPEEADFIEDHLSAHLGTFPSDKDTNGLIDYTYRDSEMEFVQESRELYKALENSRYANITIQGYLENRSEAFLQAFPNRAPYLRLKPFLMRASPPLRYCCNSNHQHIGMASKIHWTIWEMFCHIMGIDNSMMSEHVDPDSKAYLKQVEVEKWKLFKLEYRNMLDTFYTQIYKEVPDERVESLLDDFRALLMEEYLQAQR